MDTYVQRGTRPETAAEEDGHSIAYLLRELREETFTLAKQEVALAKTEMKEKVSKIGRNATYLGIGALIGYAGVIFLLFAAVRGITVALTNAGISPDTALWLSPLIVGAAVLIIGLALVFKGKNGIAKEKLVPEKTIQSIKEETSWTRTKIKEA